MKSTKPARSKGVFSPEELAAMQEAKAERRQSGKTDGEADVRAKIEAMSGLDRELAERIHAIVRRVAPGLTPKTWYGMPAYANSDGKVICFFTPAAKFKERYASFGFNAAAKLDEGHMWATSFALTALTDAEERRLADLVRKAAG